ncbi:MAG: hypothetical protein MUP68_18080 [Deltaproteobacteria bacterium]|nr:hypothetical protein [Deltaproteobacteria bacterium]
MSPGEKDRSEVGLPKDGNPGKGVGLPQGIKKSLLDDLGDLIARVLSWEG